MLIQTNEQTNEAIATLSSITQKHYMSFAALDVSLMMTHQFVFTN
jgi:hypothetical protein